MNDEDIIRNAFKYPSLLTIEREVELLRQMKVDAIIRQRNLNRIITAGSFDPIEAKRINALAKKAYDKKLLAGAWGNSN